MTTCPRCHVRLRRRQSRKFCEACGSSLPLHRRIDGTVVALIVLVGLALVVKRINRKPDLLVRIDEAGAVLDQADKMWESGKRPEAVQKYKDFLRIEEHYQFHRQLPVAYRRVIEYDADNGNPGEARDWIGLAWNEWPGQRMQLSFESERAERLWRDVTARQQ